MTEVPEKFHKPFYKVTLGQLGAGSWEGNTWQVILDKHNNLPCFMVWVQVGYHTTFN